MLVRVSVDELRLQPVSFDLVLTAESLDLKGLGIGAADEVRMQGQARLAGDGMQLTGRLSASIEQPCARCAEPVRLTIGRAFELLYQPETLLQDASEVEIHQADTELAFFAGGEVELADVAREQLLLELPMQVYCRPDCRGLCARCGANLNQGPCACPPETDPRWQALRELREGN